MGDIQWTKVLCPVDFSEESRAALRVAADLARRFGAELTLFHAEAPTSRLQAATASDGQLADWKREAERLGVTRAATATAAGEPQTAIVDLAAKGRYDLVVMGTHGRTGRDRALIGSVAENVVRRSRVPVLVVHADWPSP